MNRDSSLAVLMDTISECATLLLYEAMAANPEPSATGPGREWRLEEIQRLTGSLEQRIGQDPDEWEDAFRELDGFSFPACPDPPAPLRQVDCFLNILAQSLAGAPPGPGRAKDASARLGRFVEELLDFSRLARLPLVPGTVRLDRLVPDLLEALAKETKGRVVTWKVSPLPALHADPDLVRTVFRHLIGNAIKATRGRDWAEIQMGCAPGPEGYRTLFVRDNGVGFDPAEAHLLFGPCQRRPRPGPFLQGPGLGLACVQRIVQRHGGRIWPESGPGRGATFYLAFPDPPGSNRRAD